MTTDEYLANAPEPQQTTLRALRETLLRLIPDGEEGISYGVPAIRLNGTPVAGYAHAKRHCSYFPHSGQVLDAIDPSLLEGYDWSKGTLRFPVDQVPNDELLEQIIAVRRSMLLNS